MIIREGGVGNRGMADGAGEMSMADVIRSRRNVREYLGRAIAAADLDEILEAGRRSPSSRNTQPWDFIVVTGSAQLRRLATVWFGGAHIGRAAAAVALITAAESVEHPQVQFDLGQATMSIMLAAAGLGIGSCHSAIGDHGLARELLGYPADRTCAILISLGYPAGRPLTPIRVPDRRPFRDVVHRDHW